MHRILILCGLLFIPTVLFASQLVRHPDGNGTLQERQDWAFQAASGQKSFWLGYSISRLMLPNESYMSGVSINGVFRIHGKKPSLQEWLLGKKKDPEMSIKDAAKAELDQSEKNAKEIWKEVGIFLKFQRGAKFPDRIQVITLTLSSSFDSPLYWAGNATHEESFAYIARLYENATGKDQKEDLMAAVGVHPAPLAFPFLKKILETDQPVEAQEAAAIFMGEVETPEALSLLRQVANHGKQEDVREAAVVGIAELRSREALEVLSEIARSHKEPEVRETAIAMLGDKQEQGTVKTLEEIAWFDSDEDIRETAVVMLAESDLGVPALLKIMEEHPSKETREIAVHMLAETVAGRKILKEKIKQ